jgi:hypothetical protein
VIVGAWGGALYFDNFEESGAWLVFVSPVLLVLGLELEAWISADADPGVFLGRPRFLTGAGSLGTSHVVDVIVSEVEILDCACEGSGFTVLLFVSSFSSSGSAPLSSPISVAT